MCLSQKPVQQAQSPAPPPPPPANAPASPVLNEAAAESANGSMALAAKRRGTSSLTIGLNPPTSGGGLAI
jgi:hypothetical protein